MCLALYMNHLIMVVPSSCPFYFFIFIFFHNAHFTAVETGAEKSTGDCPRPHH